MTESKDLEAFQRMFLGIANPDRGVRNCSTLSENPSFEFSE
jgi:hypothetical protein